MQEDVIKKGLNIYLYYWTLIAFAFFIIINSFLSNFKIESLNTGIMISVVSFLFGFLITISFSMLLSRTATLREVLSIETGRLISLFLLSKHLGEKFHKSIENKIDEYTIRTLREYTHYEVGREIIYNIYNDLKSAEIKNNFQGSVLNSFLYNLGELEPVRERLENITGVRLLWSLKLSNYLLGIILILLLFLNRGDSFTNILFVILSTIVIFILLIIEDYDNLRIGAYHLNISDSEQIFDLIGRERYYPKNILKMAKLEKGKVYRIGIFDPLEKKEKIFRLPYSSYFDINISRITERFWKKKNQQKD